jgi:hypothetical protein
MEKIMSKKKQATLCTSIFLSLVSCISSNLATANTLLDGKNITTAFYFPNQNTIGFGGVPVETTVGSGIETAASPQGFPIASIDFSDTAIELNFFQTLTGTVAQFNGWRFYDATNTIPAFTNAVLTTTNTTGWTVSFDKDNIWLNGSGSHYSVNSALRIEVSAVPEPETYAMLLAGLGLLGFMARHRKNA